MNKKAVFAAALALCLGLAACGSKAPSQEEVEEAIRRMTSLPAQFFRLKNKGLLREGFDADLVVFDPFTIGCPSDYHTTGPNQGLKAVYIAGQKVVEDNIYNGTCVGQVIRAGR